MPAKPNGPAGFTLTEKRKLQIRLLAWYWRQARDLPWRRTSDPYRIWISEVMLQQTQVATVVPYYRRFLREFPSVKKLAQAKLDQVLKAWEGLGYYRRARALHRAASMILREQHGRIPRTAAELLRLPGVGEYTSQAIASIAFQEPVPVVDGNVKRVLARLLLIRRPLDQPAIIRSVWKKAGDLLPGAHPGDFNQALMELGACICLPREPKCAQCPMRGFCRAYALKVTGKVPVLVKRKFRPHHQVVAVVLEKQGRFLLGQRPVRGLLGGLWEFPGGKARLGENLEQALARELKEELGIEVEIKAALPAIAHAYTHFSITLHAFRCRLPGRQKPKPLFHSRLAWVRPGDFSSLAMPTATLKLIRSQPEIFRAV